LTLTGITDGTSTALLAAELMHGQSMDMRGFGRDAVYGGCSRLTASHDYRERLLRLQEDFTRRLEWGRVNKTAEK
jgi:hypothetical protein